jgi:hypothetical protein
VRKNLIPYNYNLIQTKIISIFYSEVFLLENGSNWSHFTYSKCYLGGKSGFGQIYSWLLRMVLFIYLFIIYCSPGV